jgi:hypothetical protein
VVWHPDLTARIKAERPDCVKTPYNGRSRYFLRLWISNTGTVRAEKVEVCISRASQVVSGELKDIPQFTPMSLSWSPYDKPNIVKDGISPKMGRYCDLGSIGDPEIRELSPNPADWKIVRMALRTEILPAPTQFLHPGTYRFEILTAAANRRPVPYVVDFDLRGFYFEDEAEMFQKGFSVSIRKE